MTSDSERLIAVKIFNIYPYADIQPGIGGGQNFLVFLKGEESKVVPITIGHFEGQALALAIKKITSPRPLPHHLLQNLLEKMKARVHKLVIHSLKEEVFHAYLLIQLQDETFFLDCRPSDGMILSALIEIPIFISREVMEEAGRVLEIEQAEKENKMPERGRYREVKTAGITSEKPVTIRTDQSSAEAPPMSELEKLKAQLTLLIAEEAYEQAAKIRDQIRQMEEKN